MTRRIRVDSNRCSLCGLCTLVCAERLTGVSDLSLSAIRVSNELPVSFKTRFNYCLQCDQGFCIKTCPEGALIRGRENVVILDKEKCNTCNGQFLCVKECKYGGLFNDSNYSYPLKCDTCQDDQPRCVTICPVKAIELT